MTRRRIGTAAVSTVVFAVTVAALCVANLLAARHERNRILPQEVSKEDVGFAAQVALRWKTALKRNRERTDREMARQPLEVCDPGIVIGVESGHRLWASCSDLLLGNEWSKRVHRQS